MSTAPRRARSPLLALRAGVLGAALLLVACNSTGSYRVAWTFVDGRMFSPGEEGNVGFTPGDCGRYGVSSIAIAGTSDDGTGDNAVAACAPGTFSRELPTGTWSLVLTALDAEGRIKAPGVVDRLNNRTTVVVLRDQVARPKDDPVFLPPLPECSDGVDNDGDGRVDLDDDGCQSNPDGDAECRLADGTRCPLSP